MPIDVANAMETEVYPTSGVATPAWAHMVPGRGEFLSALVNHVTSTLIPEPSGVGRNGPGPTTRISSLTYNINNSSCFQVAI